MKLSEMKELYVRAKWAYYNEEKEIISDPEFDHLEDQLRKRAPDWKELDQTGVRIADEKEAVELVHFMPSLEKAYPEDVPKFAKREPSTTKYFGMSKLDGTSLQLVYKGRKPRMLITRGDGEVGRDVSYLIPKLVEYKRIPATIPTKAQTVLRLEALMADEKFQKKYSKQAAGENGFENARAMVNGLFNRSWSSRALKDVSLVVLGIYPNADETLLLRSLKNADTWGFEVVTYGRLDKLDAAYLTEQLNKARYLSPYRLDGFVVSPVDFVMDYDSADKPKRMFAFKVNDEANADVVEVIAIQWKKTRLGRWQPKIKIKPIEIDGVTVTQATAHNATWMKEKGIGVGALVRILRSGDVIPKIVGTVKRAAWTPPPGPYEFRGRFVYALDNDTTVTDVRRLHFFCTTLGIEQFAEKSLAKLYDMGITTTDKLVQVATQPLPSAFEAGCIAEFGKAQWPKMMRELKRVLCAPVSLKSLMVASGCFTEGGMGVRKLAQLEEAGMSMKTLCNLDRHGIWNEVGKIRGFKHATIEVLVKGVYEFRKWYRPLKGMIKIDGDLPQKKQASGTKLAGVNVAWTSYRSKDEEAKVESLGGTVVPYGSKMTVLLYREGAKFVGKIEKAGSKAMTWAQFTTKYLT
ncbi:DNA ligase [Burkholderia phage BcepSauron]|uniref:DNA ligase (NAD(+)) n=2 Tax=Sarumanvirus TaxID=2843450 RepID=A0A482MLX1_9CAUD|nr:NAD-dependent DNA ligase [Burkholderia phage BcepSaruman]YP_009904494.1 NAD-dependent DNA ligase [Burkholderia phage BcepSauron]QBQ74496.1 DNA ligase [Burkholderia phage BcepSauron]QBX06530.1 NAD-dependent DNA ligase [Burkholderia phage BcepSaruman]